MAATPKRKISNTRRKHRRVNLKVVAFNTKPCKKCKAEIRPHTVCKTCGEYNK